MAASSQRSLAEVQRRVAEVHHGADPEEQLRFYDGWAPEYEQTTTATHLNKGREFLDLGANTGKALFPVAALLASKGRDTQRWAFYSDFGRWGSLIQEKDVTVLHYQAPQLAASCLASAFQGPHSDVLVLDVACGTGLVAQEAKGFCRFHGLDGSEGMLEHARRKGLYQELKQCMLGQEALPASSGFYDAVLIVGALSNGQVPTSIIPELLRVTKPGGFLCLTTRNNQSNLQYKSQMQQLLDDLEQKGLWEKVKVQEVEQWERATSQQESQGGSDYISGVIYLYRKSSSVGF